MFHMGRRFRRLTWLGVVLHVLLLSVASFEHHDLACHRTTPQHCTSCAANQPGASPHVFAVPGACNLADAGSPVSFQLVAESVLLSARSTGRSPPPFV